MRQDCVHHLAAVIVIPQNCVHHLAAVLSTTWLCKNKLFVAAFVVI